MKKHIDRLYKIPLIVSTCLLCLAHGSNEVNVSAPSAALFFLLDKHTFYVTNTEAIEGIAIGLCSLIFGFVTLGKRFLNKHRKKFMNTSLINGFIANTSTSIILCFCSTVG